MPASAIRRLIKTGNYTCTALKCTLGAYHYACIAFNFQKTTTISRHQICRKETTPKRYIHCSCSDWQSTSFTHISRQRPRRLRRNSHVDATTQHTHPRHWLAAVCCCGFSRRVCDVITAASIKLLRTATPATGRWCRVRSTVQRAQAVKTVPLTSRHWARLGNTYLNLMHHCMLSLRQQAETWVCPWMINKRACCCCCDKLVGYYKIVTYCLPRGWGGQWLVYIFLAINHLAKRQTCAEADMAIWGRVATALSKTVRYLPATQIQNSWYGVRFRG